MSLIEIDTLQKLIDFSIGTYGRGSANDYLDVSLTADLDFADLTENNVPYNWAGCTGEWYCHFDGRNHTIKNINYKDISAWGFFYAIRGSVKNLSLVDMLVETTGANQNLATVALFAIGTIENIKISGQIKAQNGNTRGIAGGWGTGGQGTLSIKNCSFSGYNEAQYNALGIGSLNNGTGGFIANCGVRGEITAHAENVLIFGETFPTMCDCYFIGVVKVLTNNHQNYIKYRSLLADSYVVLKSGTTNRFNNDGNLYNFYYDSDVATAASLTIPYGEGATTAQLQNATWLREKGFAV